MCGQSKPIHDIAAKSMTPFKSLQQESMSMSHKRRKSNAKLYSLRLQNSSPFDPAWVLRNVIEGELKKLVACESYYYILVLK